MHALARGLSAAHDVHLVRGGRPVPYVRGAAEPRLIELPPVARIEGRIVALGTTAPIDSVLADRARELARAVEHLRPDVLLIDHYPFSRLELEAEITAAIDAARACNPAVRILCSIRDIVCQTRYEQTDRQSYEERVVAALRSRFDGLLVHADPAFTHIEEHFARCPDLPVPIEYTGFVIDPPSLAIEALVAGPYAVLSCGGGAGGLAFLLAAMEAFRHLVDEGALGPLQLVVFPAAFASDADLETLAAAAERGPFHVRRFGPEFGSVLDGSALSISRAGYNTCVALLRSRIRAVLAPDPATSDQRFRAGRFSELGLATIVPGAAPDVEAIMAGIRRVMAEPPSRHTLDLDGVTRTRALIENLDAWTRSRRSEGRDAILTG